jgi:hypothetical protein
MFHSLPAMLVAGLITFLAYHHPVMELRAYLAIGVMVGFLSHLVLDELCAVDFRGLTPKLNQFAGSAVKLTSESWLANFVCYGLLIGLGYAAYGQYKQTPAPTPLAREPLHFQEKPLDKQPLRWQPLTRADSR